MIVHQKGNWSITRNPGSLDGFGPNVRGVITREGDLYLESLSDGTIHHDILLILDEKALLGVPFRKGWSSKTPDRSGFLTIQRYNDTRSPKYRMLPFNCSRPTAP